MMKKNWKWMLACAGCVLLLSAGAPAADGGMWLHVRVDEGDDGAKVRVNLPLSLVEKAWPMIPGHHGHGSFEPWREAHLDLEQLREIWIEIRNSPDMTFVTVEEHGENVRVWKESGYLNVRVDEADSEQVDVRLPEAVVEALLGSESPDIGSLVEALAAHGGGDLVTVNDRRSGDRVRVWVDDTPEAE